MKFTYSTNKAPSGDFVAQVRITEDDGLCDAVGQARDFDELEAFKKAVGFAVDYSRTGTVVLQQQWGEA